MAKKPVLTAAEAAKMIPDGATIMCGGFLACGQARAIVKELVKLGTKDLTLIANDMGRATGPSGEEFFGIAELIHNHQVKRVIATEGQTVDILYDGNGYGTVYVDGEPLDEPYILEPMVLPYYDRTSFPLTVDEGCLVVMGDNRNRSADSRYASIGQIEESQVIGKVLCILFPGCGESSSRDFGRIGALDNG